MRGEKTSKLKLQRWMRLAKSPPLAAAAFFFNIFACVGWLRHGTSVPPHTSVPSINLVPSAWMHGPQRGSRSRPHPLEDLEWTLEGARRLRKKVLIESLGMRQGIVNISFVPGFEDLDPRLMKEACRFMLLLHDDKRVWCAKVKENPYGAVQLFDMCQDELLERFVYAEELLEYLVDQQRHAPPLTEEAEMYLATRARERVFNKRKRIVKRYIGNIRRISFAAEERGQTHFSFVEPTTLEEVCKWLKNTWGEEAARALVKEDPVGFARFCEQPMKDIDGCKQACQSLKEVAAKFADSKARQPPEST